MNWCCPGCKIGFESPGGRIRIPEHAAPNGSTCVWSGRSHTVIVPTVRVTHDHSPVPEGHESLLMEAKPPPKEAPKE
jgi:hypothetical protein